MSKVISETIRLSEDAVLDMIRTYYKTAHPDKNIAIDVKYDYDFYDSDREWFDGVEVQIYS